MAGRSEVGLPGLQEGPGAGAGLGPGEPAAGAVHGEPCGAEAPGRAEPLMSVLLLLLMVAAADPPAKPAAGPEVAPVTVTATPTTAPPADVTVQVSSDPEGLKDGGVSI